MPQCPLERPRASAPSLLLPSLRSTGGTSGGVKLGSAQDPGAGLPSPGLLPPPPPGGTGEALKHRQGQFMEGTTCRQRHPSTVSKMKNGVYLASEGVFAFNIAAERRKHGKVFFQQANPRLLTASGKLKYPQRFFPHRVLI